MAEFKKEYKQAVDRLEPDSRLIESLRADMKAAAAPKPGFFVRYGWVFGSAAACLVLVLAVGVFLTLGNVRELSGGSSNGMAEDIANNGDLEGVIEAPTENAPYNAAADCEKSADPEADEGAYPVTSDNLDTDAQETESSAVTTTHKTANESFFPVAAEDGTDVYQLLLAEAKQIETLKALSYSELDTLVAIKQEDRLILSDFARYDYIDALTYDGYYLFMRYSQDEVSFPVVAVFQWMSPEDPIVSLKLYFNYEVPFYIDLMQMSQKDLENCLLTDYLLILGYNAIPLVTDEVRSLRSVSSDMMTEWAERAENGTLTYGDLEKGGHIIHTPVNGYECYTMGSRYYDERTDRDYAVVSCYFVQSAETEPAYVILRDMDSGETLDLLREYNMLERFLAQ